jgi:hypothetical protein
MAQNLISLTFTDADLAEIDALLGQLEAKLSGLITLTADQRRMINKMGDKSEAFCRQTLNVMSQNLQLVPPGLGLEEAKKDLACRDALRARLPRLLQLLAKVQDTEMALGSDVMTASLEAYGVLKVMGKGSGLEALRQGISERFSKSPRATPTGKEGATEAQ